MVAKKKSVKKASYNAFLLNYGYVESASMAEVYLSCSDSFPSVSEALKAFAEDLLTHLKEEGGKVGKDASKILERIKKEQPELPTLESSPDLDDPDEEWIVAQVREFMSGDMDGWGYFLVDSGHGWNANDIGAGNGVVISIQKAPEMIAMAALGTLTQHEINCYFNAHTIKVGASNDKIILK